MEEKTDKMEMVLFPLSRFDFTGTIGFGKSFFKSLNVLEKCPKNLSDMPDHLELGDSIPYVLTQTDIILQLASNNNSVNRMVLQNDLYLRYPENYHARNYGSLSGPQGPALDIFGAINGWANITDVHAGFHRTDGRNLMGFYDGNFKPR